MYRRYILYYMYMMYTIYMSYVCMYTPIYPYVLGQRVERVVLEALQRLGSV